MSYGKELVGVENTVGYCRRYKELREVCLATHVQSGQKRRALYYVPCAKLVIFKLENALGTSA